MADDENRLALVERGAGDDGVIVGEAAIAVQLDEVGEQALDVVERGRARRVPRHLHALPRRQVAVEIAAHGVDAAFEPRDLLVAILAGLERGKRLDLLQQLADRFFEFEEVRHSRVRRSG